MTAPRAALPLALVLLGAAASCGLGTSEPTPAPLAGDPPPDAAPDDAGGPVAPPPDAGPPRRTVVQRNPFGDVAETDNLLWDGDFEWSSPLADQYGWYVFPPIGYLTTSAIRFGYVCHSGLKCAEVPRAVTLIAIGVGSAGSKLEASFWAHPAAASCAGIKATVTDIYGGNTNDPDAPLAALSATPDADGWCRFDTVIAARASKPYVAVKNATGGTLLLDDVVLKKAPATRLLTVEHGPPTAADDAERAAMRAGVASLRGPHDPPPDTALRRLQEAWKP